MKRCHYRKHFYLPPDKCLTLKLFFNPGAVFTTSTSACCHYPLDICVVAL